MSSKSLRQKRVSVTHVQIRVYDHHTGTPQKAKLNTVHMENVTGGEKTGMQI